jgi:pimeloyl-ACP methyl ester carboxylesterase
MASARAYTQQLSNISLHLEDSAATRAPVVLCLHGFPDSIRTWDALRPELEAAGYRVIVPALPGYAPSGLQTDNDYRVPTLARTFVELLDSLKLEQVHVVGHDWGAVIAYALANLAPQRVASMLTAAVPHPRALRPHPAQLRLSWYMAYFQLPGAASRVAANNLQFLDRLWQVWSPQWKYTQADIQPVKEALGQRPHLQAALDYYRAIPKALLAPGATRDLQLVFARTSVPTRCVAGVDDGCMRLASFDSSAAAFSGPYDLLPMAQAGHFMHREQPAAFAAAVLDWFGHYPLHTAAP